MAKLIFPTGASNTGFTDLITSSSRNTPEPIIRELLQNCLDAAEDTGSGADGKPNPAEIVFTIDHCKFSSIPGFREYERAFISACDARKKGTQGDDEKRIIKRIESVRRKNPVKVLFCRDNGIGLNDERITNLLWSGNTSKEKEKGQTGAFGLGHLFAFQASDLRYVVYAGRCKNGGATASEIASGHAILAAHPDEKQNSCLPEGYYVEKISPKYDEQHTYTNQVPAILREQIDAIANSSSGTGAVVGILGFNDFLTEDPDEAKDEILRAAARNFFVAIHYGKMQIKVVDAKAGREDYLNSNTIEATLRSIQGERRARLSGFLAGRRAFDAYHTLIEGDLLTVGDAQIFVREMDKAEARKQREVILCRNGMWITHAVPECRSWDFTHTRPFNAVISLDDKAGDLHRLIRSAEGPEHREIYKTNLKPSERKKLTKLLQEIASKIREHVGEIDTKGDYRPPGFALIDHMEIREAAKRKPLRPPGSHPGGQSPKSGKKKASSKKRKDTPSEPRAATPTHTTSRPVPDPDGKVHAFRAAFSFPETLPSSPYFAVRVYLEGGSDESCEQPFRFQPLKLSEIILGDTVFQPDSATSEEILVPSAALAPKQGTATTEALAISLAEPLDASDASATRIELYKHKQQKSENDTGDEDELSAVI